MYKIEYTREFQKDYMKLKQYPSMVRKLKKLINGLYENPFYHAEKLEPKWKNRYSLRINIQHRLVYNVNIDEQKIKLLSCWTYYE